METFADKYNAITGAIAAVMTVVFGAYWYVFVLYFGLNIIDWLTGWYNAKKKKTESSRVGAQGIFKKVGYWAVVLVAFIISGCLVRIGDDLLGVNLSFLNLIGWWVLAMMIVNEARSILENLVEIGCYVPPVLIRGLAVTEKLIEAGIEMPGEDGGEGQEGTEGKEDTE